MIRPAGAALLLVTAALLAGCKPDPHAAVCATPGAALGLRAIYLSYVDYDQDTQKYRSVIEDGTTFQVTHARFRGYDSDAKAVECSADVHVKWPDALFAGLPLYASGQSGDYFADYTIPDDPNAGMKTSLVGANQLAVVLQSRSLLDNKSFDGLDGDQNDPFACGGPAGGLYGACTSPAWAKTRKALEDDGLTPLQAKRVMGVTGLAPDDPVDAAAARAAP